MDNKEQQKLEQIDDAIFFPIISTGVRRSVINVISNNPELDDIELRIKIGESIVEYFDSSIGTGKMGILLCSIGCFSNPRTVLEDYKKKYLEYYKTCSLPLVNTKKTLRKIATIEKELNRKIDEILKDERKLRGFCHLYWDTKKKILLEDYGITWYSPAECNPDIIYD